MLQNNLSKGNSQRRQALEDSVEHLSRLLEAERASAHAQESTPPGTRVSTALDALMAGSKARAPTITPPYVEFSKGVKAGYEDGDGQIWAVLDFEPSNRAQAEATGGPVRAPRLGVHPVFSGNKSSRWMTLEAAVEPFQIADDAELKISLMAEFTFGDPYQSLHSNVVKVTLRGENPGDPFEEIDFGYFPVTSIPTAHSFVNKDARLNSAWLESFSSLRIIIWLPFTGNYRFNLYGLSVGFS